jgi:hypothetical protein
MTQQRRNSASNLSFFTEDPHSSSVTHRSVEGDHSMSRHIRFASWAITLFLLSVAVPLPAQQKPQWMPGQVGLNAGIQPSPGFSYSNITVGYYSGTFNGPQGKAIPATGSYNVWAAESLLIYVPHFTFFGGHLGAMAILTPASGSLDADLQIPSAGNANLSGAAGGSGLADFFVQPFTLAWHLPRADIQVADGLMCPTGRYSPGATNNVGTGYLGNHQMTGTTLYITKNKATSANLFTDWEVHGSRPGTYNTSKTPGQAFTDEWGFGQVLPLKKNFSQLLQVGVIGYDQWQITANGGTVPVGSTGLTAPARLLPYYQVHAAGVQATYIMPAKNLSLNFKYEHEYDAQSHFIGSTFVFGGAWTLRIPKAPAPKS